MLAARAGFSRINKAHRARDVTSQYVTAVKVQNVCLWLAADQIRSAGRLTAASDPKRTSKSSATVSPPATEIATLVVWCLAPILRPEIVVQVCDVGQRRELDDYGS